MAADAHNKAQQSVRSSNNKTSDNKARTAHVVAGFIECAPVESGLGAASSSPVLHDLLGPISSPCVEQFCADRKTPSESEAIARFQETLSLDGPLPTPIVNFDEDVLISSMLQDKDCSTMGAKLRRIRNKKGKKIIPSDTPISDNFADEHNLHLAAHDIT